MMRKVAAISLALVSPVFAVLVFLLGYFTENKQILQQYGVSETSAKSLAIGGSVVVALVGFWILPNVLFDGFLRRVWRKSLQKKANELGVEVQLACCAVDEDDRSISECKTALPERAG